MLNSPRAGGTKFPGTTQMLHQLGSIDLTGAELEYGASCLNILNGKLGRINPETGLANGHLSVISQIKPSLFLSRVRIAWRNLEFELMMISIQDLSLQSELKLKFVARCLSMPKTKRFLLD
jgi:hypothetical protein